ncbi:DUF262 domain-containing protein [Bifidobacterium mongoliense]|uniref:DUF262 domain-containing protein n=1 Tax=Bifidobacterium mongoliense TaxID=518643 RepID=UPI0030EED290
MDEQKDSGDAGQAQKPANSRSIRELLEQPMKIPEYQRPYTWGPNNMRQLIEDVRLFMQQYEEYRIGTIILYSPTNHVETDPDNTVHEVVDGQQRIISFLLICRALREILKDRDESHSTVKPTLPECDLQLAPPAGNQTIATHLVENYRLAKQMLRGMAHGDGGEDELTSFMTFFFDHCYVTTFTTNKLDEAFQMFDSQNSRGKALDPTDLLKAFHLREMEEEGLSDNQQREIVKTWESVAPRYIQTLFADYLYPIRLWSRGESLVHHPFSAATIDEFKGIRLHTQSTGHQWSKHYIYAYDFVRQIEQETQASVSSGVLQPIEYPFQIDQPVIDGSLFFKMVEHYLAACEHSLHRGSHDADGLMVDEFDHPQNIDDVDRYITDPRLSLCILLFDRLVLYYTDRFGEERLHEATTAIFIYAFILRLGLRTVQRRSIDKFVLAHDERRSIPHINAFLALRNATTPNDFLSALVFSREQITAVEQNGDPGRTTGRNGYRDCLTSIFDALVPDDTMDDSSQSNESPHEANKKQQYLDVLRSLHHVDNEIWQLFDALKSVGIITHTKNSWSYHSPLWSGGQRRGSAMEELKRLLDNDDTNTTPTGGSR